MFVRLGELPVETAHQVWPVCCSLKGSKQKEMVWLVETKQTSEQAETRWNETIQHKQKSTYVETCRVKTCQNPNKPTAQTN